MQDIRWKQRFENFEKAYIFLKKSVQKDSYDELQAAGNELTLCYNEEQSKKAVRLIREEYFSAIEQVYLKLKNLSFLKSA